MAKEKQYKVTHPEYGHVIFTGMTTRQIEILDTYQNVCNSQELYPNNQEFGREARKILTSKVKS